MLLLLAACLSTPEPLPDPATVTTEWSACDHGGLAAECATLSLPWDHDAPQGERFDAALVRVPSALTETAHLWLLDDGPGGSALDDLAPTLGDVAIALPNVTLYALDHRGVGGTAPLRCAAQGDASEEGARITDAEWPGCVEELAADPHLPLLTMTQAARDLGAAIDATRGASVDVAAYAAGYGAALALRVEQVRPGLLDALVLDGVMDPAIGLRGADRAMDDVGRALLDLCAADRTCGDHFDGDPWEVAQRVVASLDAGHCPALGLDADGARALLGRMLARDRVRDAVPGAVRRLERCSEADVAALQRLIAALPPPPGLTPAALHVALSDLWFESADPEAALADWRSLTMSEGVEARLAARSAGWPRYSPDLRRDAPPAFGGALLALQGGLDPVTPAGPALALVERYTGEAQHVPPFPTAAHRVVGGATLPDATDCGERLLATFLADPFGALDARCARDVLPPPGDGWPDTNRELFGTVDAWGRD